MYFPQFARMAPRRALNACDVLLSRRRTLAKLEPHQEFAAVPAHLLIATPLLESLFVVALGPMRRSTPYPRLVPALIVSNSWNERQTRRCIVWARSFPCPTRRTKSVNSFLQVVA